VNRESKVARLLICALAVSAMPAAAQDAVGRLFFTPSQRASLDVARTQRARTGLAGETEEQAAPAAQTLRYGGMVRRSDGKSTVWINNRAVNDNETAGSAVVGRVRPDGGITLQIPQTGRNVTLKPGQSVELLSGTVEEHYIRGGGGGAASPTQDPKKRTEPTPVENTARSKEDDAKRAQRDREDAQQEQLKEALTQALRDLESGKLKPPPAAPGSVPPPSTSSR
jgi:hypothetical protein